MMSADQKRFLELAEKELAPRHRLLEAAGKVLTVETLLLVNGTSSINAKGMAILDRWALNEPEKLKALEERSQTLLLMRVIAQQNEEAAILETPEALEQLRNGLVPHEILTMHEVDMGIHPMSSEL